MNILIIISKIVIIAISLGFIADRTIKYIANKGSQTFLKYFVSIVVWIFVIISSFIAPFSTDKQNFYFLFLYYLSVFGFFLIFKLLNIIERLEYKLNELVKKLAIKELNEKKKIKK